MGLRIENMPDTSLRGLTQGRAGMSARSIEETASPYRETEPRGQEARITAGFGENTISIPGIAAQAVRRNLAEARKIVPTLEEVRYAQEAQAEKRRTEAREELAAHSKAPEEGVPEPPIRSDFQRAESQASAQAQQSLDAVNQAGEEVRAQESQAPGLSGVQPFAFASPTAAKLDLRG